METIGIRIGMCVQAQVEDKEATQHMPPFETILGYVAGLTPLSDGNVVQVFDHKTKKLIGVTEGAISGIPFTVARLKKAGFRTTEPMMMTKQMVSRFGRRFTFILDRNDSSLRVVTHGYTAADYTYLDFVHELQRIYDVLNIEDDLWRKEW